MKIGLTGSQGTGKTTIFNKLTGYNKIESVPRYIFKKYGVDFRTLGVDDRSRYQELIVLEQKTQEQFNTNFITDRTLFDMLAISYTLPVYNKIRIDIISYFKEYGLYDMVFYFPIEFDLLADGVRSTSKEIQKETDKLTLMFLNDFKQPYIKVSGSIEDRLKTVNKFLEK